MRSPSISRFCVPFLFAAVPAAAQNGEPGWAQRTIEPVTMPTIFEGPVIDSHVRPMFMYQKIAPDSAFDGGDFQVYALQARYAVTDRLAIIATKDGWIDFNPDVGRDEEGFADIAGGVKYAFFEDPERGVLVTGGLVLETDLGNGEVFQGNGDGLIRPFVSGLWVVDRVNVMATVGFDQPFDTGEESSRIDYHVHFDSEVVDNLFPLVELNGITYVHDGNALPVSFEGADLINLGAADVAGHTLVTAAAGARYRVHEDVDVGVAGQVPISGHEDLLEWRLTVDFVWRF